MLKLCSTVFSCGLSIPFNLMLNIKECRVVPAAASTTTDREIWLTTAIKYSVIMWEKKLL